MKKKAKTKHSADIYFVECIKDRFYPSKGKAETLISSCVRTAVLDSSFWKRVKHNYEDIAFSFIIKGITNIPSPNQYHSPLAMAYRADLYFVITHYYSGEKCLLYVMRDYEKKY
jgi:hypothetical protein